MIFLEVGNNIMKVDCISGFKEYNSGGDMLWLVFFFVIVNRVRDMYVYF